MRLICVKDAWLTALAFCAMACQAEPPPTPYPTYTLYPTFTPYPTYTPSATSETLSSAEIEELIWPTGPRDDVIPFEDAAGFIGEEVTVEGTIIRTHNSGKAVFLNFTSDRDSAFTAVIFPEDWPKFPAPPEHLFAGKLVRIKGLVEVYQDAPEIIIRDPWQIEVALTLGQPVLTDCNCQLAEQTLPPVTSTQLLTSTPTVELLLAPETPDAAVVSTPATVTDQVISWQDAATYAGQRVTVEGHVVDTYNSGKVVFLNFAQDFQTTFKVVIFPEAWPLFPAPPETHYRDKTVRVTGQIKLYQNAPEIIVDQPNQIEIVVE